MSTSKTRKPPQTIEHVAYHEAGHFVAAYFQATHAHIHAVTIVPSGGAAGLTMGEHPLEDDCSEREVASAIIELFAGHAAETHLDPSRQDAARVTASGDDAKADEFLRWICKSKAERYNLEQRLRLQAGSLVTEHWAAVTALARELLARKTIDTYEASWVVAIAEGEQAKVDLAAYRRRLCQPTEAEAIRKSLEKSKRRGRRAHVRMRRRQHA